MSPTCPERLAEVLVALLGCVAVVGIGSVYLGLSFDTYRWVLPLAVPLAVLVLAAPSGGPVRKDLPGAVPWRPAEISALAGLCALAALATALLHRPGGDDAYYLNAILAHLEHPDLPMLSFDGMHGDPTVPINQVSHRPQVYEITLAWVSHWTGVSGRILYWVVFPPVWAALIPLSNALLARRIAPRAAVVQAALVCVLLLLWGDGHRAFGNYAFVRIYQGKGLLISVVVPLVIWCALRFSRTPSIRTWALLLCAQVMGVGASSSGLVVLPVCAGIALLACVRRPWELFVAAVGVTASTPILAVLVRVQTELWSDPLGEEGHVRAWTTLLGEHRAWLVLGLFFAGPVLAWGAGLPGRALWLRLVGWSVVLVLNPVSSRFAGTIAALFSYRLTWAVPVPTLIALTLAVGCTLRGRTGHVGRAVCAVLLVVFALRGDRTWDDPDLFVALGEDRVLRKPEAAAREVLARTGPNDLVLAPYRVAGRLTNHSGRPRLVAVRDLYVLNLTRHFGEVEADERMALLKLAGANATPAERKLALKVLPDWCPDLVVANESGTVPRDFKKAGFKRVKRVAGYVLFVPGPEGCSPAERTRGTPGTVTPPG